MSLKNCLKNEYAIILKTQNDIKWETDIKCITTPMTVTFAVSAQDPGQEIKKITWDFGTGNMQKSFTNRKQDLNLFGVDCKYKKSHDTTITIQASVYTDQDVFCLNPINTITINPILKAHYVEPEVFKEQILTYYKTNIFTNEVAESIYKIANRLAFAGNFINYTYREEMVGDAVIRMIEALTQQKFDPEKGNPFSYFTKIAFHAFCNRIKKEKKTRQALTDYQNEIYNGMASDGHMPYKHHNNHNADEHDNNFNYENI